MQRGYDFFSTFAADAPSAAASTSRIKLTSALLPPPRVVGSEQSTANAVHIDVPSAACAKLGGANRVHPNPDSRSARRFSIVSVTSHAAFAPSIVQTTRATSLHPPRDTVDFHHAPSSA